MEDPKPEKVSDDDIRDMDVCARNLERAVAHCKVFPSDVVKEREELVHIRICARWLLEIVGKYL